MRVVSVNVGQPRVVRIGAEDVVSGIWKVPAAGLQAIGPLGVQGDHVANTKHHGGPDQAVYLYTAQDYDWWTQRLLEHGQDEPLQAGVFGENLTLSTFGETEVRIGDRFEMGEVVLEVTAPRIPCATFAARMNDLSFVRKFRDARRPGCYARVMQSGRLQAGDEVRRTPAPPAYPTITEVFDLWYEKSPPTELLRRVLAAPVAERARLHYGDLLASRPN
ncbi:MOSC domain-containing protein [Deinococcus peraridilitoris]|uniref:MOSC domain-containing protein n=1 Tax=Deinococcus peraridilitoris (strain DSM 19664 / LMG 22246 / CIP 109416 / KR-200) TaxID=937777 RepID=L0A4X0_DEIPD|nr:MOSC domain-containing protein [Deinococcus peraridilitoris]AFZ68933.1 hypothetical protein Deipe_3500 [Deinococcus peraridilitoris DSM 19664]